MKFLYIILNNIFLYTKNDISNENYSVDKFSTKYVLFLNEHLI